MGTLLAFLLTASSATGPVLGIDGAQFTLDDEPAFLLGISYYGALAIEDEATVAADCEALRKYGFNWVRVWATWDMLGHDVTAVAVDGSKRPPYLGRLRRLCRIAGQHGMVVDVTLTRGKGPSFPSNLEQHRAVLGTLTRELLPFRNVYFDVGNERNVGDDRFVSLEEVGELIAFVKSIDPDRLCTASQGGDIGEKELGRYLDVGKVDFITPHRPRNPESPSETKETTERYLEWMKQLRTVPVHYQEPFRRGYGRERWTARDFITDLNGARESGAAGWCFHNGSVRNVPGNEDGRPRRSFDLRKEEGRLLDQMDEVERAFLEALKEQPDGQ